MQPAPVPPLHAAVPSRRSRLDDLVATSVRRAGPSDVAALVAVINRAYLAEAFVFDGDRTDAAEVGEMSRRGHFLVLDRVDRAGLAAAVFVRKDGDRGYFGMLSVDDDLQGLGIGRRMVAVAEALCTALGCTAMDLRVVNLRDELPPWYRSLGYAEVGTEPIVGPSKRPCHFVKMTKSLVAPM